MCLSETWLIDGLSFTQPHSSEFDFFISNAKKDFSMGRASGGLMIIITNKIFTSSLLFKNDYYIFIKDNFLQILDLQLKNLINVNSERLPIFIGGDFNSRKSTCLLNQLDSFMLLENSLLYPDRKSNDPKDFNRGRTTADYFESNGLLNGRSKSDYPAISHTMGPVVPALGI